MREDGYIFKWADIGDIEIGRPNLGPTTNVAVYRLMQYTMRSILNQKYGAEEASQLLYNSGYLAGKELCKNLLDKSLDFYPFVSQLQALLKDLRIGILRIEHSDLEKMHFTLTVAEDLDCSGLPITEETVCEYDEGFISGIFEEYTGRAFSVQETDCWSSGEIVCRFEVTPQAE